MDDEFVSGFRQVPAGVKSASRLRRRAARTRRDHDGRGRPIAAALPRHRPRPVIDRHLPARLRQDPRADPASQAFAYTDEGQLLGHISIGVEMLSEKAAKVPDLTGEPFPRELMLRLQHMILSHHGTLEWGSAKVPMTLEAIALHALDMRSRGRGCTSSCARSATDRECPARRGRSTTRALEARIFKGGAARGDSFQPKATRPKWQ